MTCYFDAPSYYKAKSVPMQYKPEGKQGLCLRPILGWLGGWVGTWVGGWVGTWWVLGWVVGWVGGWVGGYLGGWVGK